MPTAELLVHTDDFIAWLDYELKDDEYELLRERIEQIRLRSDIAVLVTA